LPTIYQRVLGERFGAMDAALQRFLGSDVGGQARGRLRVRRFGGWPLGLVATAMGIPPDGEYEMHLEVTPRGDGQRWVRRFGGYTLATVQAARAGLLVEWSGPASLGFELIVADGALRFRARRAWILGMPIPLWLAPEIEAENRALESGNWWVHVRFRLPRLGPLAEYVGEVAPEGVA
jgi:hypothetical protein